ncbi:hypothetical protein HAX54_005128, partial [Datura stramonium]|nr:hypothetical protein [Datura stramonium]
MAPKGKEVVVADQCLNRGRKGKMGASFSASKVGPSRRFRAKMVEPHGLTWYITQKEA